MNVPGTVAGLMVPWVRCASALTNLVRLTPAVALKDPANRRAVWTALTRDVTSLVLWGTTYALATHLGMDPHWAAVTAGVTGLGAAAADGRDVYRWLKPMWAYSF
jgi:hypothetical protein